MAAMWVLSEIRSLQIRNEAVNRTTFVLCKLEDQFDANSPHRLQSAILESGWASNMRDWPKGRQPNLDSDRPGLHLESPLEQFIPQDCQLAAALVQPLTHLHEPGPNPTVQWMPRYRYPLQARSYPRYFVLTECPHLTVGMWVNSCNQALKRDFLQLYSFQEHGLLLLSRVRLKSQSAHRLARCVLSRDHSLPDCRRWSSLNNDCH